MSPPAARLRGSTHVFAPCTETTRPLSQSTLPIAAGGPNRLETRFYLPPPIELSPVVLASLRVAVLDLRHSEDQGTATRLWGGGREVG